MAFEKLTQGEIDSLLCSIQDPEAENVLFVTKYDFSHPDVLDPEQKNFLSKKLEAAAANLTSIFSQYRQFNCFSSQEGIHQLTAREFFRSLFTPSYVFKFTVNGMCGFINLEPHFVDKIFLRHSVKFKNGKFDPLDIQICKTFFVQPILNQIKELFSFESDANNSSMKDADFTEVEFFNFNIEPFQDEMGAVANLNFSINVEDYIGNIFFGKTMLDKMKENGILHNLPSLVKESAVTGNTFVRLGKFYLKDDAVLSSGTIYELDRNFESELELIKNNQIIAKGLPVRFADSFGIQITSISGIQNVQKVHEKKEFKMPPIELKSDGKEASLDQSEIDRLFGNSSSETKKTESVIQEGNITISQDKFEENIKNAQSSGISLNQNELDKLFAPKPAEKTEAKPEVKNEIKVLGKKLIPGNVDVILGNFELDEGEELSEKAVVELSNNSLQKADIYKDEKFLGQGEITVLKNGKLAVKIL